MHNLPNSYNREAYYPQEYLAMSAARRNAPGAPALRPRPPRDVSIPGVSASQDRDEYLMASRRDRSIPEIEQQLRRNDIERQILLKEMSYPMPHAAAPALPPAASGYRRSDLYHNSRMQDPSDSANDVMVHQNRILDDTTRMDTNLPLHRERSIVNDEMSRRILASSKTHKEIMRMAARDLQSRARGGQLTAMSQHQLPRESHQLQEQSIQRQQRPSPTHHEPMRMRMSPPMPQPQALRTGYPLSHTTMLRELEAEVMEKESLAAEAAGETAPRGRYLDPHTRMLRELEDEVERETLAAEAAAAGLHAGGANYGPRSTERNSGNPRPPAA